MKRDDIEQMLNDCMQRVSKLTEWEHNFIFGTHKYFTSNNTISQKVYDVLERIWDEVTAL